jgi:DsbC/DsbD-like thiol-disulfide interchange protein
MKTANLCLFAAMALCVIHSVPAEGQNHARVSMVADVSAIQPGVPFTVGFTFDIDPGWHIYWKNPGDSGLATDVKLKLPSGFSAGELLFPIPKQLQLPGDIINYAYEKQVMLMIRVTPPKDLPAGQSVSLSAKASWLVCHEDCVPGSGEVSLDLPVGPAATAANVELFKQWTDQLPLKDDRVDIASKAQSVSITNGDGKAELSIGWKAVPSDVQFIPGPLKSGDIEDVKVVTSDASTKVSFKIKNHSRAADGSDPITGLLTFTSAAGVKTGVEISMR